jgi:putative flippase GtrA/acetyl esterase/lipase
MNAASLKAALVIATTAGVPGASQVVRVLTGEPRVEETEIGGVPATVAAPACGGPWPAALVLNGATPLGNRHRAVQRLASSLARAGYLAVLPELPGLEEGEVDARTAEATVRAAEATATRPDVRAGRVALLGVSTGAGLALLAAADERLRGRVSVVAGVAPFADLRLVLRLATTGVYERDGRLVPYRTVPLLGRVVARSLAASLPAGGDRELLLGWLPASGEERDPLVPLPADLYARLGRDGRAVADALANRDPARFDDLFLALPPGAHELVTLLSPGRQELEIDAPVELVTAPDDGYFPLGEAEQLAAALPTSRLTVTSALEHVRLRTTPRGFRDLLGLGGAAIRSLRAAAAVGRSSPRARGAGQPLRFLTVGAGGYGVNLLAFAALYAAGLSYAASAVAAYLLANALMYLGNRYFTFRLGHDGLLRGYLRYVVVGLLVVVLNVVLLAGLVEGAGLDPRVGQALSLLALTPVAFVVNKRWTFQLASA